MRNWRRELPESGLVQGERRLTMNEMMLQAARLALSQDGRAEFELAEPEPRPARLYQPVSGEDDARHNRLRERRKRERRNRRAGRAKMG